MVHDAEDIAALDRQWEVEREGYMVTDRDGNRFIQNDRRSALGSLVFVVTGIVWTSLAISNGAPIVFPILGAVVILFGIGVSVNAYRKAGRYRRAYSAYQRRREELLAKQGQR